MQSRKQVGPYELRWRRSLSTDLDFSCFPLSRNFFRLGFFFTFRPEKHWTGEIHAFLSQGFAAPGSFAGRHRQKPHNSGLLQQQLETVLSRLKGTVSRDFLDSIFFINLLLLVLLEVPIRYHCGERPTEVNACILITHMVYL